ncbi:MAG: hypothetical protein LUI07_09675 [Lachnospiraceae bacterium]|nr:hypothetical protein [Lachnospiraceae bacterium]
MITAVREDVSAIGYISMGSLGTLEDEKVLKVDGVEATTENIKSGI